MANNYIWITTQQEMIHNYPDAPDEVAFLRHPHRHLLKAKVYIEVFSHDREIEFFMFKDTVEVLLAQTIKGTIIKSCEMISNSLAKEIQGGYPNRDIKIELSEDGENGSEYFYPKSINLNTNDD